TQLHQILILFMGHGSELIFASIFIYRAMSGRSIVHSVERPLYAFIGILIVLHDVQFSYRLMTSADYRLEYGEAQGGGDWMDFSRIANEHMNGKLVLLSLLFLIYCFLTPLISYLIFRYRARFEGLASRLLSPAG